MLPQGQRKMMIKMRRGISRSRSSSQSQSDPENKNTRRVNAYIFYTQNRKNNAGTFKMASPVAPQEGLGHKNRRECVQFIEVVLIMERFKIYDLNNHKRAHTHAASTHARTHTHAPTNASPTHPHIHTNTHATV